MSLIMTTFIITTFSKKGLFLRLIITRLPHYAECHYAECHYAECHYTECCIFFIVIPGVVAPNKTPAYCIKGISYRVKSFTVQAVIISLMKLYVWNRKSVRYSKLLNPKFTFEQI
jgi:hypothetical protein